LALLTFALAEVKAESEAVKAASAHAEPYTGEPGPPALWLVGDEGVYLMGNDKGRVPECAGGRPVVYAKECPRGADEAKREAFGGDDGVEPIRLRDVEAWLVAAEHLGHTEVALDLKPESLALAFAWSEP
jgi:hypothetical protein